MDLVVGSEVAAARAPVALESTLVAHGLPWPDNHIIARELEATVRAHGAVPATIAVIEGVARIGLTSETLEALARAGPQFAKAGATDLAVHAARRTSAATTVSATSVLAARAGIRVFATGGIGGVHRGDAWDVSHDLVALARTPIAVVSAGAKAVLDLPRTLEMLETLGVLTIGYQTSELPAFYTASSGISLEHRSDSITEIAAITREHWSLGGGGVLVCNPIPSADALESVEEIVARCVSDAQTSGISRKQLTPYLLARLADATDGASVRANRALALSNARVAAELALAIAAGEV